VAAFFNFLLFVLFRLTIVLVVVSEEDESNIESDKAFSELDESSVNKSSNSLVLSSDVDNEDDDDSGDKDTSFLLFFDFTFLLFDRDSVRWCLSLLLETRLDFEALVKTLELDGASFFGFLDVATTVADDEDVV
jgi:hypothetical protein